METFLFEKDGRKRAALEIDCTTCNTKFLKRKDWVRENNYCTKACAASRLKTKVEVACAKCKKTFLKKPSSINVIKSGLTFCSRQCKDEAQRVESGFDAIQPDHYGDGGTRYRELAFRNFPHQCHHCGYNEYVELLQVHHIDSDRANNSLENLVILCPTHHWAITIRKAIMGSDKIWHWAG